MAKREPQFDVQRVSSMCMRYPADSRIKKQIIKQESENFKRIINNINMIMKSL